MTRCRALYERLLLDSKKITLRKLGIGLLLSALSGVLLGLSFPLTDIFPLAWIGFVPLLLAMRGVSGKRGWGYALFGGFVFWLVIAYWMKTFHPLSLFTAIPALAIYFSLPFLIYLILPRLFGERVHRFRPLILSLFWVAVEYFRSTGFLGYSWGVIGYSQYLFTPIIQIADIGGVWAISFVIIFFNTSLVEFLMKRFVDEEKSKHTWRMLWPALIFIFLTLGYGGLRLSEKTPPGTYRVAMIQAFTDPAKDWRSKEISYQTMAKIERITSMATNRGADLIIWSETLMARKALFFHKYFSTAPGDSFYRKVGDWFYTFAKRMKHDMLLTAPHAEYIVKRRGARLYTTKASYNAAFFFTKDGELKGEYRKIWLVPFGEWFPFKDTFPWIARILEKTIASNFTPGEKYVVFHSKKARFSVAICFEDIFGDLCRRFILGGADFLINTTNDYWSRSIQSQEQHFAISVLRAIENRRYLVRAANTGVTCIVDAWGRIVKRLPNNMIDILVGDIPLMRDRGKTIYTKLGDWLGIITLYLLLATLIAGFALGSYKVVRKVIILVRREK